MDKEAFSRLYEEIYKDLYRFAFYSLRNRQDAEDVVGEAVAAAFEGISGLRRLDSFKPWIFKILTIRCKRKLKEYANKTLPLEEIPSVECNLEESQDVRNAFFTLNSQERLIISMSVFGGYNSREIGRMLFIKDSTVRSKLSRAFIKLQQLLGE